ncbi:MAG: hypothetical protein JWQ60_169, partial [Pseudonocardia sp.]|nr:hypothetical protein [Pseudonocardia sp.]
MGTSTEGQPAGALTAEMTTRPDEALGRHIRTARTAHNLTLEQLAERTGLSR